MTSVGVGNPFGHPSPATLGRLVQAGARSYRTDRDGDIAVVDRGGVLTSEASDGGGTVAAQDAAGNLERIPGTTLTARAADLSRLPLNWCVPARVRDPPK
jgi:hypothetical protein